MASSLASAVLNAVVKLQHQNAPDVLSTANDPLSITEENSFLAGAGANQANQAWHDQRTLTTGANEELDLNGTALQNIYGEDLAFVRIKGMFIRNTSAAGILLVGGAAANAFVNWVSSATDEIILRAGGSLLLIAPDATGYVVTATTGDLLRIEDDGSSGVDTIYDIVLIGATT